MHDGTLASWHAGTLANLLIPPDRLDVHVGEMDG